MACRRFQHCCSIYGLINLLWCYRLSLKVTIFVLVLQVESEGDDVMVLQVESDGDDLCDGVAG